MFVRGGGRAREVGSAGLFVAGLLGFYALLCGLYTSRRPERQSWGSRLRGMGTVCSFQLPDMIPCTSCCRGRGGFRLRFRRSRGLVRGVAARFLV